MMKKLLFLFIVIAIATPAFAQAPVTMNMNQQALLESDDPQVAADKKLVFDFWREVFNGGNADKIPEYIGEEYIQHNPNVPSGREAFMGFMSGREPGTTPDSIPGLVTIFAEEGMVIRAFRREIDDPRNAGQTYTTTWFDMFRVENNMIVEHWDYGTINP